MPEWIKYLNDDERKRLNAIDAGEQLQDLQIEDSQAARASAHTAITGE